VNTEENNALHPRFSVSKEASMVMAEGISKTVYVSIEKNFILVVSLG
jgi:hypothetical protein